VSSATSTTKSAVSSAALTVKSATSSAAPAIPLPISSKIPACDFMKYSHSKAMAVFYKIVKLVKNGVLMIIHIYAKVSH
jgi:hypothetical protein